MRCKACGRWFGPEPSDCQCGVGRSAKERALEGRERSYLTDTSFHQGFDLAWASAQEEISKLEYALAEAVRTR